MKFRTYTLGVAAAALLATLSATGANATILVDQNAANVYGDYKVGSAEWTGWLDFTNALAAQSGGYAIGSVANATSVAAADAILIVARSNYGPSTTLTAQEKSNLTAFLATGGRVVIVGDAADNLYSDWTNSVVNFASAGAASVATYSGAATAIAGSELTDGVGSVNLQGAGVVTGGTGTALFNKNWATLWGDNLLTVLDVNALTRFPAPAFRDNVADWLGASQPTAAVPEPASWAMMIAGFAVIGSGMRRQAKAKAGIRFA